MNSKIFKIDNSGKSRAFFLKKGKILTKMSISNLRKITLKKKRP